MESFKQNIILLATFSIFILYMITPANADIKLCMVELMLDNFNVDSIEGDDLVLLGTIGTQNIAHAQQPIENFQTPYGKGYHKRLFVQGVFQYPIIFCQWMDGIFENDDQWNFLKAEIEMDIEINLCMAELNEDDFNTNSTNEFNLEVISNENSTHAQIPETFFNTPFGIAYRRILKENNAYISPKDFCKFIIDNDNFDFYRNNLRSIIEDNVFKLSNLCKHDLDRVRYNMSLVNQYDINDIANYDIRLENVSNAQNPRVRYTTTHGTAYRRRILDYEDYIPPIYFCDWIYGHFEYSFRWKKIKSNIAYDTCIKQLRHDKFNSESPSWEVNIQKIIDGTIKIENVHSVHGLKYWSYLVLAERIPEYKLNVKNFCERYCSNYISRIIN